MVSEKAKGDKINIAQLDLSLFPPFPLQLDLSPFPLQQASARQTAVLLCRAHEWVLDDLLLCQDLLAR